MAITSEASRMKLKIQPKLPVFLHADAYFDLNVAVMNARGVEKGLEGLPLVVNCLAPEVRGSPGVVVVDPLSPRSINKSGVCSMRVKILDDKRARGRRIRIKVAAEGHRSIMPAVSDYVTVVRCSLKISEDPRNRIPERWVIDGSKGSKHLDMQVYLAGPNGERIRDRRVSLRVGLDYEHRWTRNPGKPSRILSVVGSRALDRNGETTLRLRSSDICKGWPCPPYTQELRFVVEADQEGSDIGPGLSHRITVLTTEASTPRNGRGKATIRLKPFAFARNLSPGRAPATPRGDQSSSGGPSKQSVKRSQSFDSYSPFPRPWSKGSGPLASPTCFEASENTPGPRSRIRSDVQEKGVRTGFEQDPDVSRETRRSSWAPSPRRNTASLARTTEVVPPNGDVESSRFGSSSGHSTDFSGGSEGDNSERRPSPNAQGEGGRGTPKATSSAALPPLERHDLFRSRQGKEDGDAGPVSGLPAAGAEGDPAGDDRGPRADVDGGRMHSGSPRLPSSSEDDVYHILLTRYMSRKGAVFGFPAYDWTGSLLGFFKEVSGPGEKYQETFTPLGSIPGFDERDAGATKSMFVAASRRLTRSLVSRDRCQGSMDLMKKQAFGKSLSDSDAGIRAASGQTTVVRDGGRALVAGPSKRGLIKLNSGLVSPEGPRSYKATGIVEAPPLYEELTVIPEKFDRDPPGIKEEVIRHFDSFEDRGNDQGSGSDRDDVRGFDESRRDAAIGARAGVVVQEGREPGDSPASYEDGVFYIVPTYYWSRKRSMLGFPAYDQRRALLGFFNETQTHPGRSQVVLTPSHRIPDLDDKDRGATKAMLIAAIARGTDADVVTRDGCNGSLEAMTHLAFRGTDGRFGVRSDSTGPALNETEETDLFVSDEQMGERRSPSWILGEQPGFKSRMSLGASFRPRSSSPAFPTEGPLSATVDDVDEHREGIPSCTVPEHDVGAWPFPLQGPDEADETAVSRDHVPRLPREDSDPVFVPIVVGNPNKLDPLSANKGTFNETDTEIDAGDPECRRDSERSLAEPTVTPSSSSSAEESC